MTFCETSFIALRYLLCYNRTIIVGRVEEVKTKGSLLVLIAGLSWGISGVSGQYLMMHGANVNLLTSLRLMVSGTILCFIVYFKEKHKFLQVIKSKRALVNILLFSLLGLLMNQYTYLSAIKYTNAGTATVLQYMSPVIILAIISMTEKRLPSVAEALSIILAILGTVIIATHGQFGSLAITPKGLVWGLLSALSAALYILLPVKLIQEWGSLIVIGLAMVFSGSLFTIVARPWNYHIDMNLGNLIALFGLIVIGTIVAYTLFLKGTSIVGPVNGSLLASVEPIASVFFAVILLAETFYPMDLLGMLLIMLAVLLISLRDFLLLRKEKTFSEIN